MCDFVEEKVKKANSESKDEAKSYRERVSEERNLLFQPHSSTNAGKGNSRGKKRKAGKADKSWSFQFVCLADRFSRKTPSGIEKQILYKAGLGLKKVKLEAEDDEEKVKDV